MTPREQKEHKEYPCEDPSNCPLYWTDDGHHILCSDCGEDILESIVKK